MCRALYSEVSPSLTVDPLSFLSPRVRRDRDPGLTELPRLRGTQGLTFRKPQVYRGESKAHLVGAGLHLRGGLPRIGFLAYSEPQRRCVSRPTHCSTARGGPAGVSEPSPGRELMVQLFFVLYGVLALAFLSGYYVTLACPDFGCPAAPVMLLIGNVAYWHNTRQR